MGTFNFFQGRKMLFILFSLVLLMSCDKVPDLKEKALNFLNQFTNEQESTDSQSKPVEPEVPKPKEVIPVNVFITVIDEDSVAQPGVLIQWQNSAIYQTNSKGQISFTTVLTEGEKISLNLKDPNYSISRVEGPPIFAQQKNLQYLVQITSPQKKLHPAETATLETRKLTLIFDTQNYPLIEPIEIYQQNVRLAKTQQNTCELEVTDKVFEKPLKLKAPFFKEKVIELSPDVKTIEIPLEPILVQMVIYDSLRLPHTSTENVKILYKNKEIARTNESGMALVPIPQPGRVEFTFLKEDVFKKQKRILNITDTEVMYRIGLIPIPHFVMIRVVDDANRPVKNTPVQLAGRGVAISGTTDQKGFVRLESYRLVGDTDYQFMLPTKHETRRITISSKNLDSRSNPILVEIVTRNEWTITTDDPSASITIFDARGKQVGSGIGRVKASLPRGVFKVVAKNNENEKTLMLKSDSPPFSKRILLRDCYLEANRLLQQNPEATLPHELVECLDKEIKPNNSNYENAKMLLAKIYFDQKKYGRSYQVYQEILRNNIKKKYDPILLYHIALSGMMIGINGSAGKQVEAFKDAYDVISEAMIYKTKLPIKSRKKWMLKFNFLKGEICYRLFLAFLADMDKTSERDKYLEDAKVYLGEFIRDYEAVSAISPLKQELEKDYQRAKDVYNNLMEY